MSPSTFESPSAARRERSAIWAEPLPGALDLLASVEAQAGAETWLLDSAARGAGRLGRFSFGGADPYLVLRARGERVELDCRRPLRAGLETGRSVVEHDLFDLLRQLLPPVPPASAFASASASASEMDALTSTALPFLGGAVGYFGYELGEKTLPLSLHGWDDLGLADAIFLFVDRFFAIDHEQGRAYAIGLGFATDAGAARERARVLARELAASARFASSGSGSARSPDTPDPERAGLLATPLPRNLEVLFDEAAYAKAVASILDDIGAGNVYQANLTHRLSLACNSDPLALYRKLRRVNPAPFAAYLGLPELAILSSSPERFLCVDSEGRVEARPIKGTRPRGADPKQDARLAAELATSEKDRAENLMIVDLMRNDLGRVCETGSIRVPERMTIETHPSVFQLVSSVEGRLGDGRDALDLVQAAFPPGSMTGAPKIAAVQVLDRLEPVRRGVYAGALGYLDLRGGLDLSVVIRTILLKEGRAHLHVGGGIVADSDPVEEYRESLDKARALLAALEPE